MSSITPGFEYDIFISYRHNDNRSGWVTEFVKALEEELAATIKEPVSVYFDVNPHDGLLETHSVDKSLEGKLKCLIFIPIISQTYCDQKSFAWQHEFCAFNKLAKEDQFGRDVKLSNGNVASRILPVKIHDLDADDKTTIESEISSVLRSIEFIFKSAGVNRSLRSQEDHPQDNLNRTFYRDQINKVANAVKEIIATLKAPAYQTAGTTPKAAALKSKPNRKIISLIALVLLFLVAAVYFFYPKLISSEQSHDEIDKSVAVLAFVDMSQSKDQEWFADGLADEILNSLTKLNELKVTARTSSFYFKGKDVSLQEIAGSLGVAHILEGSVRKLDDKLRITAQLIRVNDGFHIWSETYDRSTDDLFKVQADIAEHVAKALLKELSPEKQKILASIKPLSIEAYEYYLRGTKIHLDQYLVTGSLIYFEEAEKYLLKSISLEPDYAEAYGGLANLYDTRAYKSTDTLIEVKYIARRDSMLQIGYRINPESPEVLLVCHEAAYGRDQNDSAFYFLKAAYHFSPNMAIINHSISNFYGNAVGLPGLALKYGERAVELDPLSPLYLKHLLYAQYDAEYFDDAIKTGKRIVELNMQDVEVYQCLFMISLIRNNREQALGYVKTIEEVSPEEGARLTLYTLALMGSKPVGPIDDLIVLSMLKMKTEFLKVLDKKTAPDKDGFIYTEPIRLSRPYYDFVRNEPEFKIILERLKKSHDAKMMKYGDIN